MNNRNVEIDVARGIAISSVVFGHIVPGMVSQVIYLFHMPFFFVISGYFHRLDDNEGRYFKKKCISLLVPYFSYLFIFKAPSVFPFLAEMVKQPSSASVIALVKHISRLLYGGEALVGDAGVFWFITCLFLTQQIFNFVGVRIKDAKSVLGIAIALYLVAFLNQVGYEQLSISWGFPWNINVVCCAFLFYAVGSIYGDALLKRQTKLLISVSAIIAGFSVALTLSGLDLSFDMKHADYGAFVLSPLTAVSMTGLLVYVCKYLAKRDFLLSTFSTLGTASITIMFLHRYFQFHSGDLCTRWPWLMTLVMIASCYALHRLFLKSSVSSALLLGSSKDLDALTKSLRWRIKTIRF